MKILPFVVLLLLSAQVSVAGLISQPNKFPYLITLFDSTDNDFYVAEIQSATFRMQGTNLAPSNCRAADGTPIVKTFEIKKPKFSDYSISLILKLEGESSSCKYQFAGGNLKIVLKSRKTNESKILLASIDRFFRNRDGGIGSDVSLSSSTDPAILGTVLMESMRPVVRILP